MPTKKLIPSRCFLVALLVAAAASTAVAADPGASSSLVLVSGTINGQNVSPSNRTVSVSPGSAINGSFQVTITSTWPSFCVMSMGLTPTWGDPSTSYIDLGHFGTPVSGLQQTIDVNFTAPTEPGTYYITAAFRAELNAGDVMSATNWSMGYLDWSTGYAVAYWAVPTINTANSAGTVLVNYEFPDGNNPSYVPATAIQIVVGSCGSNGSLCSVPGVGKPGTNNPQGTVAEPVSTGNGNYFYQHTDLTIPGRGLPLSFQRAYNSLDQYSGPLGANWTHSYNTSLNSYSSAAIVKWGDGNTEVYVLNGSVYVPPPGVFNTLAQNSDGSFTVTQKDQTQYNFTSAGVLSNITDKNGNQILFSYDGSGNLTQITDTVGRNLTLTYDSSNRIAQITDPIGRTESFAYSSNNDLATVTDPLGGVTTYAYDGAHHVTSVVLPNGALLLANTYDASGRVTAQANGRNYTTTFAYNTPAPGQTTITDSLGNGRIDTYDSELRLSQVTDALSGNISYTYDANNDTVSTSDQNGNTTTFTYDSNGNTLTVTDAAGDVKTYTYDTRNDLLSSTTPRGYETTFTYDGNGNLLTTTDPLNNVTAFTYDSYGELTSKTDANGHVTSYAYDSYGNLIQTTDALNHTTKMGYDGIGRLTSVTDANGHTSTSAYDALSRLVSTTDPLGDKTQYSYDGVGNLLQVTDANGKATGYAYDAANNLVSVTDAAKHVTQYTYDGNNNRLTFVNAKGKTTTYSYDPLNRLSEITDPLVFSTSYSYDAVGNLLSVTDANGHTNSFTYDVVNRLTKTSYFDGSNVARTYDADSNRISMVDPTGTTTYAYDPLDRLTSVSPPSGTVSYAYDPVGNRATITYPDGKAVNYAYNAVNHLNTVTDWLNQVTTYGYDPANNLTGIAYPNKAGASLSYDDANRLNQIQNAYQGSGIGNDAPFTTYTYVLDKVGNRTKVTDGSGAITTYAYNPLYELTSVNDSSGETSYTYDPVGNRLSMKTPGGTTDYEYDADDRLRNAGTTKFTYDKDGNRLTESAQGQKELRYAYDAVNRLISVKGQAPASTFTYDGDGNRVAQAVGKGSYGYVNDVAGRLFVLQESGPDGSISYAYGLGLISESGVGFDYFHHHDALGSVIGLSDATGTLQQGYAYDSWGTPTVSIGNVGKKNKFRFTGEALDPGTLLYYLRARYDDPAVGRFVTKDLFAGLTQIPSTKHRYAYAGNNPTNRRDPLGLYWDVGLAEIDYGPLSGTLALQFSSKGTSEVAGGAVGGGLGAEIASYHPGPPPPSGAGAGTQVWFALGVGLDIDIPSGEPIQDACIGLAIGAGAGGTVGVTYTSPPESGWGDETIAPHYDETISMPQ